MVYRVGLHLTVSTLLSCRIVPVLVPVQAAAAAAAAAAAPAGIAEAITGCRRLVIIVVLVHTAPIVALRHVVQRVVRSLGAR